MGQLIGVWAPCQGTGRTTITLAIAYNLAQHFKSKKVLVCCANGGDSRLIKTMGISSEELGIEDLVSFRLAGFTSNEYEKMLERKGSIFFAGSSKMTPAFLQKFITEFVSVFIELRDKFDMSIVDLPYGNDSKLCNAVLTRCDKVITVLEKDMGSFSDSDLMSVLSNKNIFVINKCDKGTNSDSGYWNMNNFGQVTYKVPYCDVLVAMNNKGKLFQYFSLETHFGREIESIVSEILELEENNSLENKTSAVNARLFGLLKINFVGGQQ